jgi:hypothetical protein
MNGGDSDAASFAKDFFEDGYLIDVCRPFLLQTLYSRS